MKIIEKIGWLMFLISLMTFIVTLIYWLIKSVANKIWDLLNLYNENLGYAVLISLGAVLLGLLFIRLGAADKEADL